MVCHSATVLFGLIAATGARIWVENGVDFGRGRNLLMAGVTLILGTGAYTDHHRQFPADRHHAGGGDCASRLQLLSLPARTLAANRTS